MPDPPTAPLDPDEPLEAAPQRRSDLLAAARRRRRRRRLVGTLAFLALGAAVIAAAVLTFAGSSDNGPSATASTSPTGAGASTSTTPPLPPAGPFALTDGVNVRSGPGTTFPTVGTLQQGTKVMVACVATGETINGPKGPTNLWARITGAGPAGYVTNQYVDTGAAADDRSKIALCPAQ